MFYRVFFLLLGFGFMIIGFMYIISYMNLMTIGYTFNEYLKFIIKRFECIITLIGFIICGITIYIPGGKKNDIYI
jgi:hypothetical protein